MGRHGSYKITQNKLSRAVRSAGRSTASSIRQIEDFQSDWRESINRKKKKSKNGQYKQTKQKVDHSTPIPTLPPPKISYQAVNTNIRPISKPSRVTPPKNQNINNSHSWTKKKDGRTKTTMPTTVLIQPQTTAATQKIPTH